MKLSANQTNQISAFQKTVWKYYRAHKRPLPWRETTDPYKILVSEIMLQQTQVGRVKEKYGAFLKKFPTVQKLAVASTGDVLRAWQGLGYNRRALNLKKAVEEIVSNYGGEVPKTVEELDALPGIGHATAAAICTYAYNMMPIAYIETNIRTVFIHHFFPKAKKVSDEKVLALVEKSLDMENPREWYSALMDYGAHLKQEVGNVSKRSGTYTKQSKFKGSDREVRGKILRLLAQADILSEKKVLKTLGRNIARSKNILEDLIGEGLVKREKTFLRLP